MHALDPQSIPTEAAVKSAKVLVARLLDRQMRENNGQYPKTITCVLWGTDNIKTYTAEVTFQNLDSSEIGLTDVSHYYDSDPPQIVAKLRDDGKMPSSFIADTTTANAQVRSLSETVRLDARTKLLNPKWYEGMLSHIRQG
jgi:cobalamin biosynthesis Mg chelatase CobN